MKPETAKPDWVVLARYLAGESPLEEAQTVRRWLAEDPARDAVLAELDRATRLPSRGAPHLDVEAALRRVKARFHEPVVLTFPARTRWWRAGIGIAAALALLVSGSLILRSIRSSRPAGPVSYATAVGRTDSVPLADGSYALLGPDSRLTIRAGYGATSRAVELEGEGLFEVIHDESRPFSVRAGGAEIHDLGTRFTVRSDPEGVRVVVESGSVRLEDTTRREPRRVTLRAGQVGVLDRNERSPVRQRNRTEADLAWLRGQLIFENASLMQVREDLRRWYGIELVIADSTLATRHISARFAGEPTEQVLRVLELALGAKVERRGDSAIVRLPVRNGRPVR